MGLLGLLHVVLIYENVSKAEANLYAVWGLLASSCLRRAFKIDSGLSRPRPSLKALLLIIRSGIIFCLSICTRSTRYEDPESGLIVVILTIGLNPKP